MSGIGTRSGSGDHVPSPATWHMYVQWRSLTWAVAIWLAMAATEPCRRHSRDSSSHHTNREHSLQPFATNKNCYRIIVTEVISYCHMI